MMSGVSMVHVPYRGGAFALTDLLGGEVQVLIEQNLAYANGTGGFSGCFGIAASVYFAVQ
jgi:hypothetical protein